MPHDDQDPLGIRTIFVIMAIATPFYIVGQIIIAPVKIVTYPVRALWRRRNG